MAKKTQKEIVLEKLETEGCVDNFWAFRNYILRLGAIVHDLRQEGYNIETEYKGTEGRKNCHYYLKTRNTLF